MYRTGNNILTLSGKVLAFYANVPSVTTTSVTSVTSTGCTVTGNVTDNGGATITQRGFAYGTGSTPTIAGSKVIITGSTGSYSGTINGLTTGVLYYVRAYAINSIGTSYGSEISFTTVSVWDNLQSYWRLNETSGTNVVDAKGIVNASTFNTTWNASGIRGYCNSGTNTGTMILPNSTYYDFERTDTFSYSLWVKRAGIGANESLIFKQYGDNSQGYALWYQGDDTIRFDVINNYNVTNWMRVITQNTYKSTTEWYHFVVTYAGTSSPSGCKIYANGVNQTLTTVADALTGTIKNSKELYLRLSNNGLIDEIGVWNRELTQAEVSALYNSGTGLFY